MTDATLRALPARVDHLETDLELELARLDGLVQAQAARIDDLEGVIAELHRAAWAEHVGESLLRDGLCEP